MINFNKNIKVLVVDDFPTMRRIVRNLIKQIGFENIDEAEDGVQAWNKLKSGNFGLILCDWNMPKMEGIDLLKNIREDAVLKDLPFVMITAEAEKEKVIEALKRGVDNYIVKPFTVEVLREKLEKIANRKPQLKA